MRLRFDLAGPASHRKPGDYAPSQLNGSVAALALVLIFLDMNIFECHAFYRGSLRVMLDGVAHECVSYRGLVDAQVPHRNI